MVACAEVDEIREVGRSIAKDGIFATAVQLYVELRGEVVVDAAWGNCGDVQVERDSLHPMYCATKPLLAVGIAHLVERELLSFDMRIEDLARSADWAPADLTLAELLCHDASLIAPSATEWRMTPRAQRSQLLNSAARSNADGYSEVAAWVILDELCSCASGMNAIEVVESLVLEPLGLQSIALSPSRALEAWACGTVRVPVAGLPVSAVPMLSEQLPVQLAEASPVFGGLASAGSLGRFYTALKGGLRGDAPPGIPGRATLEMLMMCERPPVWDSVLRRECSFRGGFMSGLAEHFISSRVSPSAIGHAAGVSNAVGLCDPELDLSLSIYMNGVAAGSADVEFARMSAIDRVLGLLVP